MVVSMIYGIPQITDIMCGPWVYSYRLRNMWFSRGSEKEVACTLFISNNATPNIQ